MRYINFATAINRKDTILQQDAAIYGTFQYAPLKTLLSSKKLPYQGASFVLSCH